MKQRHEDWSLHQGILTADSHIACRSPAIPCR